MKSIIVLSIMLCTTALFAQFNTNCPTCVADPACASQQAGSNGGLCSANILPATVGQPYDQDISFYANNRPSQGSVTVTLDSVRYDSYSGLPAGLDITLGFPGNTAYPSRNPPASQLNCFKICGTTFAAPGMYTVTLNTTGFVSDVPVIGNTSQGNSETFTIEVLPPSGGNSGFTFFPASGCDSITVDFETPIISSDPLLTPFEYVWNFDNGQTATGTTANGIVYGQQGEYSPELEVTSFEYVLTDVNVTSNSGNWFFQESICDGIGIPGIGFSKLNDSDLFFSFVNGSNLNFTSSVKTNQLTPSWSGLNITLEDQAFSFTITDEDCVGNADDVAGSATFTFTSEGTFSQTFTSSGLTFEFTIAKQATNVLSFIDSSAISVFSSPNLAGIANLGEDTVCGGEEIVLYVPFDTVDYTIRWFRDTAFLAGEADSLLRPSNSGSYKVEVTAKEGGCRTTSNFRNVRYVPLPNDPKLNATPTFDQIFTTNGSSADSVQWYFNGTPIPNATTTVLDFLGLGSYQVEFINNGECAKLSIPFVVDSLPDTTTSIALINANSIKLYPNPASSWVSVEVPDNVQNGSIVLTDVVGNVIIMSEVKAAENTRLELETLPSGLYLLQLLTDDVRITKKLFISK